MAYELLLLEIEDRIATVTINRPDKLNALNDAMMREIGSMMDELAADTNVGAIIITGAGRAFVAADGWTVVMADHRPSAHYEHTLVITKGAPLLLTAA